MRRPIALWVAVAGLGVAAVGLVAATRGGDGDGGTAAGDLPKLPISAAGQLGAGESSRMAADSVGFAPMGQYVPGPGLPVLGGSAPAYELTAEVTDASVRGLAEALGIDGEPTDDGAGYWTVDGAEMTLSVNGPDGSWSAFRREALEREPQGSAGVVDGIPHPTLVPSPLLCPDAAVEAPGSAPADDDVKPPEPCATPLPTGEGDTPQVDLQPVEPDPPVRPESLPSEAEAERIALDLLAATGAEIDGAEVRIEDAITEWYVSVEPKVDGLAAAGLGMYVGVGEEGRITNASGTVASAVELGDYPLLTTTAALRRLNESLVYYAGPAVDVAAMPEEPSATAPGGAPPDIPVTGAEIVLNAEYTTDLNDTTTYLVPAYRFTTEEGSAPEVNAVVDDLLAPPDTTPPPPAPAPETTVVEADPGGGSDGSGGGSQPGDPGDLPGVPETTIPTDDTNPGGFVELPPPALVPEGLGPEG